MTGSEIVQRFEAAADEDGMRLDAFLAVRMSAELVTRARVQKWIDDGRVSVDGRQAKSSAKMRSGAIAEVRVPAPAKIDVLPEAIPLDVLHEDADLIVVNKPAGMSTHPGAGHDTGTLVNALLAHCGDSLSGIGDALRPGIVHRLDRDTTGVLVAAKSELAHQSLSKQFHDHTASRRYHALAWGAVPALTIRARIARDPRERKRFAVTEDESAGRHATTHVTPLEPLGTATLIECRLETGRTHQIRVHLSHEGFPLVGDALYGGARVPAAVKQGGLRDAAARAGRQMLHARLLGFEHPRTHEHLELTAPLPPDMERLVGDFRSAR